MKVLNFKFVIPIFAIVALFFTGQATAQFEITSYSIDGGGGNSDGGAFEILGTIGQPESGTESSGGGFSMTGGFQPSQQDPLLLGDLNGDGIVDLLDIAPFVDAIFSTDYVPAADINQDGTVDLLDVAPFVAILTGE